MVVLPVSCLMVVLPVSCLMVVLPVSCLMVVLPVSCLMVVLPVSCLMVVLLKFPSSELFISVWKEVPYNYLQPFYGGKRHRLTADV